MTEFEQWRKARQEAEQLLQQLSPARRTGEDQPAARPAGALAAQLADSGRKAAAACRAVLRRLVRGGPDQP